jgi:hypothetical protein
MAGLAARSFAVAVAPQLNVEQRIADDERRCDLPALSRWPFLASSFF